MDYGPPDLAKYAGHYRYRFSLEDAEALFFILQKSDDPNREKFLAPFAKITGQSLDEMMGVSDNPLYKGLKAGMIQYAVDFTLCQNFFNEGLCPIEYVTSQKKIFAIKEARQVCTEAKMGSKWDDGMSVGLKAAKDACDIYFEKMGVAGAPW
jgi:hypothetical protein